MITQRFHVLLILLNGGVLIGVQLVAYRVGASNIWQTDIGKSLLDTLWFLVPVLLFLLWITFFVLIGTACFAAAIKYLAIPKLGIEVLARDETYWMRYLFWTDERQAIEAGRKQ